MLDLKKYEKLLLNLLQEAKGQKAHNVKAEKIVSVEIPDEDTQPLTEMNQVIASSRNQQRAYSIERIEAALQRLRGSPEDFGICHDCGETIPSKRLDILPYAEFCAPCQQDKDKLNQFTGRRHLTDFK